MREDAEATLWDDESGGEALTPVLAELLGSSGSRNLSGVSGVVGGRLVDEVESPKRHHGGTNEPSPETKPDSIKARGSRQQ